MENPEKKIKKSKFGIISLKRLMQSTIHHMEIWLKVTSLIFYGMLQDRFQNLTFLELLI